jgi:hypothetical protein
MVISPDAEAQILRYYHAEKWTIGTIAAQLHVHHSVVRQVLTQAGLPFARRSPRPSSGSVGVSGMVRFRARWVSLPKPSLL